jgi:hypothetical protein
LGLLVKAGLTPMLLGPTNLSWYQSGINYEQENRDFGASFGGSALRLSIEFPFLITNLTATTSPLGDNQRIKSSDA